MYKLVLDADGTIKLAKAGVLETLADNTACTLTQEVYKEIMRGKEKMYSDAFLTEKLVSKGKLTLAKISQDENEDTGAGEKSALVAFKKSDADALVTDDARFISLLKREGVRFVIPTDVIVWLVNSGKLSKTEGISALDKMKETVRKDAYEEAVSLIRGGRKWEM